MEDSQTLIYNPIYDSPLLWLLVGVSLVVSLLALFLRWKWIVNSFLLKHLLNPRDWSLKLFFLFGRYFTFNSEIWNIFTKSAHISPLKRFNWHISTPEAFREPIIVLLKWFSHCIFWRIQLVAQLCNLVQRGDRTGEETNVLLLNVQVAVFEIDRFLEIWKVFKAVAPYIETFWVEFIDIKSKSMVWAWSALAFERTVLKWSYFHLNIYKYKLK